MFDPSKFTVPQVKPLPVFLLLDVSGSMDEVLDPENTRRTGQTVESDGQMWEVVEGGTTKMQTLNEAVKRMIETFSDDEKLETEYLISIITFGDKAELHFPLSSASSIQWTDMNADGCTSMGAAFSFVKKIIEDKNLVPSRAYRPTIVLVSDGEPTDSWKDSFKALTSDGRSSKCFFMAMGIGEKPGTDTLKSFISNTPFLAEINGKKIPNVVFHASDAKQISEFFQKVTMSVTTRSRSQNPNSIPVSSNSSEEDGGYW